MIGAVNAEVFNLIAQRLKKMTGYLLAQDASPPSPADIEAVRNAMPDAPGTGRFPAIKEIDPSLPGQVIYRPADLSALGDTRLGVYAFGNGACTDDAAHTRLHLLEDDEQRTLSRRPHHHGRHDGRP